MVVTRIVIGASFSLDVSDLRERRDHAATQRSWAGALRGFNRHLSGARALVSVAAGITLFWIWLVGTCSVACYDPQPSSLTVRCNGGTGEFTVRCSEACEADVTVASTNIDIATVEPQQAVIGAQPVTFSVTGGSTEGVVDVTVSWQCGPYQGVSRVVVTNECFGCLQPQPSSLTVRCSGGTGEFVIACTGGCEGMVTVTSADEDIATVSPTGPILVGSDPVTFTVTGWHEEGTVPLTVQWVCDSQVQGQWVVMVTNECPGPPTPTGSTTANTPQSGEAAEPIDTFTGELYFVEPVDLSLRGPMPLVFNRYYASLIKTDGFIQSTLGDNWLHNFDWTLQRDEVGIAVISNRGRVFYFVDNDGVWDLASRGDFDFQLVEYSDRVVFGDPRTEMMYFFDNAGKLTKIDSGNGRVHTLMYENEQLVEVSDGLGRTLSFGYENGHLASVTDGSRVVSFGYSGDNLTEVTDELGNVTRYTYNAAGLLEAKNLPRGNTPFAQTYDAEGRVITQRDGAGQTYTIDYDAVERVTTVTDPTGQTRQHIHSPEGELLVLVDELGQTATIQYDEAGRRVGIIDRMGAQTTYAYGAGGKRTEVVHADGSKTSYSYAARAHASGIVFFDLVEISAADGAVERMEYDDRGNIVAYTNPMGARWEITRNDQGQIVGVTHPGGGVSSRTYDDRGNPISFTDPAGVCTDFECDPFNRLTTVMFGDGATVTYAYDALDRVVSITDELNHVTSFAYDENGNLTQITDALNEVTRFSYDDMDRLTRMIDPIGDQESYSYTPLGRLETLSQADGPSQVFGYDARGRLASVTNGLGKTWLRTYDAEHVITSTTDPLGNRFQFVSDPMGRIVETIFPSGDSSKTLHDSVGRPTAFESPEGETTSFEYDDRGLVSGISMEEGIDVAYSRNEFGSILDVTDPKGNHWQNVFDGSGKPVSQNDPLGNTWTWEYDERGRVSHWHSPEGSLDCTYDARGDVTSLSGSDGTDLSYSYDALGRLIEADGLDLGYDASGAVIRSNSLTMTRDALGRITSIQYGPGKVVTYTYEDCMCDLVKTVTDWNGDTTSFAYDDAEHLIAIHRPNGIRTQYEYDKNGLLVHVEEVDQAQIRLSRNKNGEITSASRTLPQSVSFSEYREIDQAFDAASRSTSSDFDGSGRLMTDTRRAYSWDLASRLVGYTEGEWVVDFTYDGIGNMVTRTENGVDTAFVWNYATDLPAIHVERAQGEDARYYITTPQGTLLYQIDAQANARRDYHFDEMGNTVFLSGPDGSISAAYAYCPYGQLLGRTGDVENPFTWQGMWGVRQEGHSGLYATRARIYDSTLGRFLTKDPIKTTHPLGLNPYQYAWGNPLLNIDPLGTDPGATRSSGGPFMFISSGFGFSHREIIRLKGDNEEFDFLSCLHPDLVGLASNVYFAALEKIYGTAGRRIIEEGLYSGNFSGASMYGKAAYGAKIFGGVTSFVMGAFDEYRLAKNQGSSTAGALVRAGYAGFVDVVMGCACTPLAIGDAATGGNISHTAKHTGRYVTAAFEHETVGKRIVRDARSGKMGVPVKIGTHFGDLLEETFELSEVVKYTPFFIISQKIAGR